MKNPGNDESGMTLVESMIAMLILLVGLLSLAQVLTFCAIASKKYGTDAGQTTAAARDKMEELTGLQYADTTTNLTVGPPFTSDGMGLRAGGSIYPAEPVAGYSDRIDVSGNKTTSATASSYIRQWRVEEIESGNLKTISVSVRPVRSFNMGVAPSTTIVTQKAP